MRDAIAGSSPAKPDCFGDTVTLTGDRAMTEQVKQTGIEEPQKPFNELFHGLVEGFIDESGLAISHGIAITNDGKVEIAVLAVPPEHCYKWLLCTAASRVDIVEIMFGIDRYTKPAQGSEFADVVTGVHWTRIGEKKGTFRSFVIDYQFGPPKIVRPVNYDNAFWNEIIKNEFQHIANSLMSAAAKRRLLEENMPGLN